MMRFDQKRSELLALPLSAPDRERTERDAMIALVSRDDVSPLRLTAFDEILARKFERGLDRLRAAADEKDVADASATSDVKKLVCAYASLSSCSRIAAKTSGCEWPREDTAAPLEASMYSFPAASRMVTPSPPAATG